LVKLERKRKRKTILYDKKLGKCLVLYGDRQLERTMDLNLVEE